MGDVRSDRSPCFWHAPDGRCANCKARRYRLDAIGMRDTYGVCRGLEDYLSCEFYRPSSMPQSVIDVSGSNDPRVNVDLGRMVKGLRSLDVEECRAALEETKDFLESGWADRKLLLAILPLTFAEDLQVRQDASWCIGKLALFKLGDPRSVDSLIILTMDRDADVRSNAAWALGELAGMQVGDTISIEALNILLTDENGTVKGMAAWALGRMADKMRITSPSSVPLLKVLLMERSEYVRKGALWALERIEKLRPV